MGTWPTDVKSLDVRLIKGSFVHVAANAEAGHGFFYSRLFVRSPEIRSMFPYAMREHMDRIFAMLTRIVWSIDSPDSLACLFSANWGGAIVNSASKTGTTNRSWRCFWKRSGISTAITGPTRPQAAWEAAWVTSPAPCGPPPGRTRRTSRPGGSARSSNTTGAAGSRDLDHQARTVGCSTRPPVPGRAGPALAPGLATTSPSRTLPAENGLIDLHVRAVPGGLVSGSLVHNTGLGDTACCSARRAAR